MTVNPRYISHDDFSPTHLTDGAVKKHGGNYSNKLHYKIPLLYDNAPCIIQCPELRAEHFQSHSIDVHLNSATKHIFNEIQNRCSEILTYHRVLLGTDKMDILYPEASGIEPLIRDGILNTQITPKTQFIDLHGLPLQHDLFQNKNVKLIPAIQLKCILCTNYFKIYTILDIAIITQN